MCSLFNSIEAPLSRLSLCQAILKQQRGKQPGDPIIILYRIRFGLPKNSLAFILLQQQGDPEVLGQNLIWQLPELQDYNKFLRYMYGVSWTEPTAV